MTARRDEPLRPIGAHRYTELERLAIVETRVDSSDDRLDDLSDDVKQIKVFVERARTWGLALLLIAPYVAKNLPPIHNWR